MSAVKMKVTVCFGNVRVIVPCSNHEMLVRDLIHQASLRYKKATGKGPESWVVVHKLKSQSDGGILDPDDKVVDVTDDREQIMAIYEEDNDGMPSLQHNAGDGTSASSVGTNSPDIFQGSEHKFQPFARTDIEITGEELTIGVGSSGGGNGTGLSLQVRRGSEPALNRLSPVHLSPPDPSKRWSAAPKIDEDGADGKESTGDADRVNVSSHSENSVVSRPGSNGALLDGGGGGLFQKHSKCSSGSSGGVSTQLQHRNNHPSNSSKYGTISSSDVEGREFGSRFSRDHHRLSMQFVGDGGYKWADAADRALSLSLRKEPLGANASPDTPLEHLAPNHFSTPHTEYPPSNNHMLNSSSNPGDSPSHKSRRTMEVVLKHETGPLGIHVVPEHNADARNQGLIVQSVEPGGRIDRDGRVQAQDKIIEINGKCLIGVQFQKAQELFREGLKSPELRLKVVKHPVNQPPPPTPPDVYSEESEKENMIEGHERIVGDSKVATVSQTKKLPLQPSSGSASTLPRPPGAVTPNLIASNTRKIGRKYEIDLQKGPQGLGFSITTRDNPAGGNCPIYIKNILPTGAAIEDGRLRPGDRLLEVNGIEITGKTQAEAVSILRNIPQGGIVKLVVSRQERVDLSPKLPRQIPPDKIEEVQPSPWSEREVLTLDIPVLDTEKAGLGISVKGKTNAVRGKMMDMGIFIKSVIHGGAASRDGRLKSNDQLLSINGVSLLNRSNTDAMETLRRTMTQDGGPKPKPGFITLTIARRVPSSSAPTTDLSGGGSSASGDETDSWSRNVSMSVDGSRSNDKSVTIESLNRSHDSNADGESNAIFVQQLPQDPPPPPPPSSSSQNRNWGGVSPNNRYSFPQQSNHVRSSSLRRSEDRSPFKSEAEARVRHRSPPPYFEHNSPSIRGSIKKSGGSGVDLPRNPVLDRLTGKSSSSLSNPSRNDSYYKATNDTWNGAFLQSVIPSRNSSEMLESGMMASHPHQSPHVAAAVMVHNARGEMVLVEDDYIAPQKPPRRSRSSTPVDGLEGSAANGKPTTSSRVSTPAGSVNVVNNGQAPSDVTYASQTSLEELGGFSRDAFGRQSMSEKRHATLDAKSTDTYQRNKKLRDERQRQKAQEDADAEQLARERNMQDQLARRGIKRPFSSSTEDELSLRATTAASQTERAFSPPCSATDGITLGYRKSSPPLPPPNAFQPRFSKYSVIGKRGDRLGLGDQLLQLLHQWGQSRQTPRTDVLGLPRVNSADSLVDALKQPSSSGQPPSSSAKAGKKSKGSYKKDIGPSLGMKKSSSLESLQTMVQEIQIQEDVKSGFVPGRAGPPSVRVVRGRGCNESFRQAVDRSYEAPLGEMANQMETLAEEETESCISGNIIGRKSDVQDPDAEGTYGKTKGAKKKQGIFRGLGSMFRFGRHRKSTGATSSAAVAAAAVARAQQQQEEAVAAARLHEELLESQHHLEQQRQKQLQRKQQHQHHYPDYVHSQTLQHGAGGHQAAPGYPYNAHHQSPPGAMHPVPLPQSSSTSGKSGRKSERSHRTDKDINGNQAPAPQHGRSTSFDVYNDAMQRPGSRMGIVDPKKYTHYINYEEIRHHLNDNTSSSQNGVTAAKNDDTANNNGKQGVNSLTETQLRQMRLTVVEQRKKAILESRRHQQHYHSQRREHPRERQERPVSNFYEYESVQAAMHAAHSAAAQSPLHGNVQHAQHHPSAFSAHVPQQHAHHPHPLHKPNMSPPAQQQQQSGLILHGQPIYGMSSAQLQLHQQHQTRLNNNNGITLPSPSGPFTVAMHQTSSSQFQVISTPVNGGTGAANRPVSSAATMDRAAGVHSAHANYPPSMMMPQRSKPNSLPRRTHKGDPNLHPIMQSTVSSGHQFPPHFPVVVPPNGSGSGRYSMHYEPTSSYAQIPEQMALPSQSNNSNNNNGVGSSYPQQQHHSMTNSSGRNGNSGRGPAPGSVLLHHQTSGSHHHHQSSFPSTNVGSKV